jgi:hypothetical protein
MGSWTEVLGLLPKVLGFDVTQGHDAGDAANRSQGRLQPLPPVLSLEDARVVRHRVAEQLRDVIQTLVDTNATPPARRR